MKIMVVEDEPDIRLFSRKAIQLHDASCEILEACNGMEAVRLMADNPPDGIFLDMLMPDMDGWEFLQVMDALGTRRPVAILTAIHRDNSTLCGVMTTYPNVVCVENKPVSLEDVGRILDLLKKHIAQ